MMELLNEFLSGSVAWGVPYAFVNWIVPIFSLTYGFTGFAIWKINKDAGNSPAESEA